MRALLLLLAACSAQADIEAAQAALEAHQLAKAEAGFRSALDKEPANLTALAGLGWTYATAGEVSAARGAFDRCVVLDPAAVACLRGLATLAGGAGDLAGATQLLARAAQIAPADPSLRASQALLALRADDVPAAAAIFEELHRQYPAEAEYAAGLAEVRLRQDRPTEALPLTEEALAANTAPTRVRAALLLLQARALVSATGGREDPQRCAETAPPLLAWLDRAAAAVDAAEALLGVTAETAAVRRLVLRRRSVVTATCPSPTP